MLIHIVCWKYRPEIEDAEREEHRSRLSALADHIACVQSLSVGADILHLERSFHTGLVAHFADQEALQTYTDHPTHQEVAAMGKKIAEQVVSVDFII